MKKRILVIITAAILLASLALSCVAVNFVISVEEKGLPIIKPEGLANENKDIVAPINEGELIIIPLSEADNTDNKEAKESLQEGYKELKDADKLSDVVPDLDKIADEIADGATSKDFSVTDVFYVDYVGQLPQSVNENGYVVLTVDLSKYNSKYDHIFMIKDNTGKWKALSKDLIQYNKNGTTAFLKISELGSTIAILQMNDNVIVKDPEQKSPQTGLTSNTNVPYYVAAGAVVVAAIAIIIAAVSKKKKFQ